MQEFATQIQDKHNETITLTRAEMEEREQQAWERGYAEGLQICKHGRRYE